MFCFLWLVVSWQTPTTPRDWRVRHRQQKTSHRTGAVDKNYCRFGSSVRLSGRRRRKLEHHPRLCHSQSWRRNRHVSWKKEVNHELTVVRRNELTEPASLQHSGAPSTELKIELKFPISPISCPRAYRIQNWTQTGRAHRIWNLTLTERVGVCSCLRSCLFLFVRRNYVDVGELDFWIYVDELTEPVYTEWVYRVSLVVDGEPSLGQVRWWDIEWVGWVYGGITVGLLVSSARKSSRIRRPSSSPSPSSSLSPSFYHCCRWWAWFLFFVVTVSLCSMSLYTYTEQLTLGPVDPRDFGEFESSVVIGGRKSFLSEDFTST